jgi:hypothetical protein
VYRDVSEDTLRDAVESPDGAPRSIWNVFNRDRAKALRGRCSPIPIFSCRAACSLACRVAELIAGDID